MRGNTGDPGFVAGAGHISGAGGFANTDPYTFAGATDSDTNAVAAGGGYAPNRQPNSIANTAALPRAAETFSRSRAVGNANAAIAAGGGYAPKPVANSSSRSGTTTCCILGRDRFCRRRRRDAGHDVS